MNSCFGLWGDTSRGSQENIFQAAALVKVQSGLLQSFGQDFRTFPGGELLSSEAAHGGMWWSCTSISDLPQKDTHVHWDTS